MSFATLDRSNLPPPSSAQHTSASASHAFPPPAPSPSSSSSTSSGPLPQLTSSLQTFSKNLSLLSSLSPSALSPGEGSLQFDAQSDVCEQLSSRLSKSLLAASSDLASLPRSEAARSRAALAKLSKDMATAEADRRRIADDVRRRRELVKVRATAAQGSDGAGDAGADALQPQQMQMQVTDVTTTMIQERDAEIRNINREMATVNEIFKDLAHIVDEQQTDIDNIETMMEQSNQHAKAGLEQVQKANEYQPGCSVM